jgi:hypothetical protein
MRDVSTPDTVSALPDTAVDSRTVYFKLEFPSNENAVAGSVIYGFVNEAVPAGYRSTAIPGVYILLVDAQLRGIYVQRVFSRITKIGLDGKPQAINAGGTRVF